LAHDKVSGFSDWWRTAGDSSASECQRQPVRAPSIVQQTECDRCEFVYWC